MLLRTFLEILQDWQAAFPRQRSYRRAVAQALGTLSAFGRRTCHALCGPWAMSSRIGVLITNSMPGPSGRRPIFSSPFSSVQYPGAKADM